MHFYKFSVSFLALSPPLGGDRLLNVIGLLLFVAVRLRIPVFTFTRQVERQDILCSVSHHQFPSLSPVLGMLPTGQANC